MRSTQSTKRAGASAAVSKVRDATITVHGRAAKSIELLSAARGESPAATFKSALREFADTLENATSAERVRMLSAANKPLPAMRANRADVVEFVQPRHSSAETQRSLAYWRQTLARCDDLASTADAARWLIDELEQLHEWAACREIELPLFNMSRAEAMAEGWIRR